MIHVYIFFITNNHYYIWDKIRYNVHINIYRVEINARRRELYRLKKAQRVERENTNADSNVAIASEIE